MTLRKKALLIIGLTLLSLILVLYFASRFIMLDSFATLEKQNTEKNIERVLSAFSDNISALNTMATDYANWDDTYNFAQNKNKDYILSNFVDITFIENRLNLLLIIDSSGDILYSKGFDFNNEKEVPISENIKQHISLDNLLLNNNPENEVSGIILLPEGPMLIASQTILTSMGQGPARGSFIMGRYLTLDEVNSLGKTTHLAITMNLFNDPDMPPDFKLVGLSLLENGPTMVKVLSTEFIAGYTLVKDIYGKPGLILKVDLSRSVYKQGTKTLKYFIFSLLVVGFVFTLLTMLILEKVVLSKSVEQEALLRTVPAMVYFKDRNLIYITGNKAFADMTGIPIKDIAGKTDFDFFPKEYAINIREEDKEVVELGRQKSNIERQITDAKGNTFWISAYKTPYLDANGEIHGMVGIDLDITERKEAENTINYISHYDSLTDLPNRVLFNNRLMQALVNAQQNQHMLVIFLIDLDRFKLINDAHGLNVGDSMLKSFSDRLIYCINEGETIARMGGDEFAILLPKINNVDDATRLAQNILKIFKQPWQIDEKKFHLTASIGISLYPNDGADTQTLLKNVDTAMYRAKEEGRNCYRFYSQSMSEDAFEKLKMENDLRSALELNEFVIHYQPRINLKTGRMVGMEALVRWQHPQMGMVSPVKFIPLAEDTGLIVPIGEWVLRTACAQNKAWQQAGLPQVYISVNLSARQFRLQNFAAIVSNVLKETGLESRWLELEITESIAMQNEEYSIRVLYNLKEMGIRLSIDDFGTGYSSLSYLKRFPIDTLKIDRSFVRDISTDPDDAAIAAAIIAMAQSLKLKVTAEGVETVAQLNFLKKLACDEMQGYLFSKPVSDEVFEQMLKENKCLQY